MRNTTDDLPHASCDAFAHNAKEQCMTIVTVRDLLRERGYEMVCRFGHIHATKDGGEWHICLIAVIDTLSSSQFLVCLDDARANSLAP